MTRHGRAGKAPCHDAAMEAAYVRAICDLAEAMQQWIASNPSAALTWREGRQLPTAELAAPGAVERLAGTPDAECLLREVDAAMGGGYTLRMARVALGLIGELPHVDEVN